MQLNNSLVTFSSQLVNTDFLVYAWFTICPCCPSVKNKYQTHELLASRTSSLNSISTSEIRHIKQMPQETEDQWHSRSLGLTQSLSPAPPALNLYPFLKNLSSSAASLHQSFLSEPPSSSLSHAPPLPTASKLHVTHLYRYLHYTEMHQCIGPVTHKSRCSQVRGWSELLFPLC